MVIRIKQSISTGVDGVISYLDGVFQQAGWSPFAVLNSSGGQPLPNPPVTTRQQLGQERIYKIVGNDLSPASSYIGMARSNAISDNIPYSILFYGFTGCKGPVPVSTLKAIDSFGTIYVTASTTTPHDFRPGDLVIANGTTDNAFHRGWTLAAGKITNLVDQVLSPTSFTYRDDTFGGGSFTNHTGSGGYVMVPYNTCGSRSTYNTARWSTADNAATINIYGAADEFRAAFIIEQSGNTIFIEVGQSGRAHVPLGFSDTAFTVSPITGPGTVTIDLDRASPNLYTSQYAWLISPDSGLFERSTISVLDQQTVQMTLVKTGAYPENSLFGDDPCPLHVLGVDANVFLSPPLSSVSAMFSFFVDGTRTDVTNSNGSSQTYKPLVDTAITAQQLTSDAVNNGYMQGCPIVYFRSSSPVGVRKMMAGTSVDLVVAWPHVSQSENDVQQTGRDVPGSYYITHPSQSILNPIGVGLAVMDVSFGPGFDP